MIHKSAPRHSLRLHLTVGIGLLLLSSFTGIPAYGTSQHGSFEEARAAAKIAKNPLLVDFFTTWCGPCKKFNAAVESDSEIQAILEQVTLYKVDAEKGDGKELAKEYGVRSYPTYFVFDQDLGVIHRWSGYRKDHFLKTVQMALDDPTPIEKVRVAFEDHPTEESAVRLAGFAYSTGQYRETTEYYRKANELEGSGKYAAQVFRVTLIARGKKEMTEADVRSAADLVLEHPTAYGLSQVAKFEISTGRYEEAIQHYRQAEQLDPSHPQTLGIFNGTLSGYRRDDLTWDQLIASANAVLDGNNGAQAISVAKSMTSIAYRAEDPDEVGKILDVTMKLTSTSASKRMLDQRANLAPDHALYFEKNERKAIELKQEIMTGRTDNWLAVPDEVNVYAWWCYQNRVALEETRELAVSTAETAKSRASRARLYNTAAEISNRMKEYDRAVELIELALVAQPANKSYQSAQRKFEAAQAAHDRISARSGE